MTDTNRTDLLYGQTLAIMREGRWLDAINVLERQAALFQKDWRLPYNLGWCYYSLDLFDDARKHLVRAARLAPKKHVCHLALGAVYVKKEQFIKAEAILKRSLRIKEFHATRVALTLAYLKQGKVADAEKTHLEGIRLHPDKSDAYKGYAIFLSDVGREEEAQRMDRKAKELRSVH